MKRHENQKDQEQQRNIEEQEQAMSELLLRVMERPLVPLHKTLDELREKLAAIQQANTNVTQSVEAGLLDVLEKQGKRLNRSFDDVTEGIDGLKEELTDLASIIDKHNNGQAERDERIQGSLVRAGDKLTQLEANADTASAAFINTARDLAKIDDALGGIREQQQTVGDQIGNELGHLGVRLERQHAQLDESIAKTTMGLERLHTKADTTTDSLAVAALGISKVDTELLTLREQEQAAASQLIIELNTLAHQLGRQQAQLCERIDTVQPGLARHFETLAATIDGATREATSNYESLSENQKVMVTAAVQEQLAIQLAPFLLRTKWLAAICGLSFASTLALLGIQLFH